MPIHKGHLYIEKTAEVDDRYYQKGGLLFWIYVLATSPTGDNLPVKGKMVKRIPSEVARDIHDPDLLQKIHQAMDQNLCWFFKLEGKGWRTRDRNGHKDVAKVQEVLDWIRRFDVQGKVRGSSLLYAEVNSKIIR